MDHVKPVYSVLIVGAGQIGAFFDKPDSPNILTHAHAITDHPSFRLIGFIDSDPFQAGRASEIWGGKSFLSIEDAMQSDCIDVVCLAVPDEYHYAYLEKLVNYEIQLVFAEKPLTKSLAEADMIKSLYANSTVDVAVNYSRRFVPEFIKLRNRIINGEFGSYLTGSGYYGKGLQHNGSHMLDLLSYLLGDIKAGLFVDEKFDFYPEDSSISVILDIAQQGKFDMQNVDCQSYTVFELDLFFTRKRVRILDSGFHVEEYDVIDSQTFSGYRNLGLTAEYPTSLGRAMEYAANNIHEHLSEGKSLLCSLEDGYKVMKICNGLRKGSIT